MRTKKPMVSAVSINIFINSSTKFSAYLPKNGDDYQIKEENKLCQGITFPFTPLFIYNVVGYQILY